eukprot:Em1077g3a
MQGAHTDGTAGGSRDAVVYVDKKRPEFYYIPIPPGHPYQGRQYMQYEPQWLRGTPLGDILAKVGWKMKCLHVGVRSDNLKQKFEAWNNKSELTGLATRMDFPPDERPMGRSIIMSFEGNHQADCCSAVEWMKKTGVKVNESWMQNCTKSQRPSASIPVTKTPTSDHLKETLTSMKEEHPIVLQSHEASTQTHNNSPVSYPANPTMEVTDTSALGTVKGSINDIIETRTLQIFDDHDLFQHLNPQMALGISSLSQRELLIPDVTSWKELFAETVPWPMHVWHGMGAVCTFTGGKVSSKDIPRPPVVMTPPRDVTVSPEAHPPPPDAHSPPPDAHSPHLMLILLHLMLILLHLMLILLHLMIILLHLMLILLHLMLILLHLMLILLHLMLILLHLMLILLHLMLILLHLMRILLHLMLILHHLMLILLLLMLILHHLMLILLHLMLIVHHLMLILLHLMFTPPDAPPPPPERILLHLMLILHHLMLI